MRKENIFSTGISVGSYHRFINEIFELTRHNTSSCVYFANVHMVVLAHRDENFRAIINGAELVAPDGKPLSVFLRIDKGIKQDRICGMDILPDLLQQAERSNKSVFFYGNTDDLLKALIQRTSKHLPFLHVAGYYSPPFRELSEKEDEGIIDMINNVHPDLLLVSLGCPKQEKWMAEHRHQLTCCMLGLGQAFNTYAGMEKRLPRWMRELSLEWMYRLYHEPRRLWKRYIVSNSVFLFLVYRHFAHKWIAALVLLFTRRHAGKSLHEER